MISTKVCLMTLFQYIQQNIRSDCSNIDKILEPPEGQDEGVWKYEHLRYVLECVFFFISCLNILFIDYSPVSKMVLTIRITAMTEKEKIFRVEFSNSSLLMLRVA